MGAIPPCMAGVYIYAEVKFSKYTFDLEEAKNSPKSWTIHTKKKSTKKCKICTRIL